MSARSIPIPQRCPESLWEELAGTDPSATIFQTPAWHRLAERFEGTRSRPLLFEGPGWRAVLPLQSRIRPWGIIHASPFGTYSGLLSDRKLDDDAMLSIRTALGGMNLRLTGSPFTANPFTDTDGEASQTRLLRLQDFDITAWETAWSRNHRRLIRDAHAAGLSVEIASGAIDVTQYAALYRAQVLRWGARARRAYPEALFHALFDLFDGDVLRLWLARDRDGVVVAGRLCLYHGTHAVEWHAAATSEAMAVGANHLLVHAAVVDAHARGFGVYDFNPNPGLPAVDHFKRGFATEPVTFHGLNTRAGIYGMLSAAREHLRMMLGKRRA